MKLKILNGLILGITGEPFYMEILMKDPMLDIPMLLKDIRGLIKANLKLMEKIILKITH